MELDTLLKFLKGMTFSQSKSYVFSEQSEEILVEHFLVLVEDLFERDFFSNLDSSLKARTLRKYELCFD